MISDVLNSEKYLNVITSQHRTKEKYINFVSNFIKTIV